MHFGIPPVLIPVMTAALMTTAFCQNPGPQPDTTPTVPSRRLSPPQLQQPAAPEEIIPIIDFPNTEIRSVLEFYERLTGKNALYDSTVQGNIHVRVTKPVSRSEAIRILETVFSLNNFTLIQGPGDIVKVINTNKNVRQFDVPIFSEIDQLPAGNQVVSFLFKLEYADPLEVKAAVDLVIAPTASLTNVIALPKSQAVMVTENSDMIRNLAQIVAKLDSKPAEVVSEFIPLTRADAKEVVEKLTKMFEKTSNPNNPTPAAPSTPTRPPTSPGSGSTMVTLSEDSLIVGKIKLEADLRTNRVHVVTRPVNLPFLRAVIADLDSGVPQGEAATRPLRFVLAGDVLDIVAGAVAEPGVEVKKLESSGRSNGAATPLANSTGNFGGYNNPYSGGYNNPYSNSRNGSSRYGGLGASNNTALQADTAPQGVIIRNTKIIADNRINAIVVVGNEEMKRKVFSLLDQIDIRAPQVMLTAVIGELLLTDDEQFGVDYLLTKGNLNQILSSGTLPWVVPGTAINGANLKNLIAASSLPSTGGGVTGLIGVSNSLDLFVSALQSTGRYRVTSRPMIFTSNNRPAIISSGEKIPIPATTTSGYTAGNTLTSTSSTDYIEVELRLSVVPLINSEGEVTLRITQEDNNTNGSTIISGNSIPNVITRSIDTTVSVANEATIVLGGLVSEKKQVSRSGVPVLCKVPVLGSLFSYKKNSTNRTELVILIKPTVTYGPVQAVKAGERAMQKTNFEPDLDATLDPPGLRVRKDDFAKPKASLRPEK